MRERVNLAGGTLDIDSGKDGTLLKACLPAADRQVSWLSLLVL